CQHGYGTPPTC
nr:immunoglobulin light chain junction region [Macaca mulatta]MPN93070.1 immunoglobulin light chain junction region [Macaca mulatta]